jgi:hypothetical protein
MAKDKRLGVGVEITGKDTDFKASVERVKKATNDLKNNSASNARAIEQNFKQVTIAIAKIAGAAIAAQKAFEFIKIGMVQTGQGADDLEKFTIKLKAGFDSLAESVVNLDFANMISNWKAASKAAGDYADSMDLVNDRLQDLSVKRAAVASSVAMLRAKQVEGTLTKEEGVELKAKTLDLLAIEKNIYDEAIAAQLKFIAEKKGLDAKLFESLQTGINVRVDMTTQELKELDNYVKLYTDYESELKQKYQTIAPAVQTGGGIFGTSGQTTLVTDMAKVNEELSKYLAHLPEAARLQIFQQKIAGEEQFKKLVEFYVKRNELEGEYAGLLNKTDKAVNKLVNSTDTLLEKQQREADARVSAQWDRIQNQGYGSTFSAFDARLRAAGSQTGDLFGFGNASGVPMSGIAKGNGELEKQIKLVNELTGVFNDMFLNIDQGWKGVIDSMLQNLERLFAYMVARAAVWLLIDVVTGGTGELFKSMGKFGKFISPFAEGGIVSEPTLAQIGEYAGASNNPEVVAPLSKLKGLIGSREITVNVKGRLQGSDIYFAGMRYQQVLYNNT